MIPSILPANQKAVDPFSKESELKKLINQNDHRQASQLLDHTHQLDIHKINSRNQPFLYLAMKKMNPSIYSEGLMRRLIDKGAHLDIEFREKNNDQPRINLLTAACTYKNLFMLETMIRHLKNNPQPYFDLDKALCISIKGSFFKGIEALLETNRIEVSQRHLEICVNSSNWQSFNYLLKSPQMNMQSLEKSGTHLLHFVVEQKSFSLALGEVIKALSHCMDINQKNDQGLSALEISVVQQNADKTHALLRSGACPYVHANPEKNADFIAQIKVMFDRKSDYFSTPQKMIEKREEVETLLENWELQCHINTQASKSGVTPNKLKI